MSFLDRLGQKLSRLVDDISVPDAVREDLVRGKAALQGGELAEAERLLLRATQTAPDLPRGFYLLGLAQLRQDRPAEAIGSLSRALELEDDSFTIVLALAEAQRSSGDELAAVGSYKRALSCRADERLLDRVYGGLGEIYLEQGEVDRAVRELRKAVAVSEGRDLRLVGLLGLAQLRDGELGLARQSLSRAAAAVPAEREVLLGLARVLLALDEPAEARLAALRLLEDSPDDVPARCLLARSQLDSGDPRAAHQELLHALQADPHNFEAHRLLAQVHVQVDDLSAAIRELRTALSLEFKTPEPGTDPQMASRRLLVALQLELGTDPACTELEADARAVLERDPADPLGLAGLAVAKSHDNLEAARQLVGQALAGTESYACRLAQGRVELAAGGETAAAAAALRAALRLDPEGRGARELLGQVYERMAGGAPGHGATDFYPALRRIRQLLLPHPELSALGTEVATIEEVFDRPLLLVVMGEFNSGKSTFVNALIGEKIAPMGITPTTATINILKYGEQRGARVVWRDDREERLAWERIGDYLTGLDRTRARQIRVVELLYPAEELLRVNIVDTPGLNSMVDEHEETAREYMTQADAVIWLFSAGQAGKQTEQQALELLKKHRLKTVGVLNKVDRLSPEELSQVLAHLQREFSQLVEDVVPAAARPALEALITNDDTSTEQLATSRFPQLRQFLEQRIFARSRRIKREVCQRRLDQVLARVVRISEQTLIAADSAIGHIDKLGRTLRGRAADQRWLEQERMRLRSALQAVYREGAVEVLDFVRPRRWVFGEHRATPADQDFLLDLLMEGLGRMADASAERIADSLKALTTEVLDPLQEALTRGPLAGLSPRLEAEQQTASDRLAVLSQQVYGRYQAFVRGYLQGGRVDSFFEQRLPRAKLEQEEIYRALLADSVDLEHELLQPLARWHQQTLARLQQQLQRLRTDVDLVRLEQDRRVLGPISELQRQLGTDPGAEAGTDPEHLGKGE